MKAVMLAASVFFIICASATGLAAHCEIPCGIYDDAMRVAMIREHIVTIEKSMKTIISLSDEDQIDYNQLVRWIDNKETHANELQYIVSRYFMTQRVKPAAGPGPEHDAYVGQVTALHKLLIATMKAKQTVDAKYIDEMRALIDQFEQLYFKK